MGKRAQNKLNNPAALCVFMLGDSGWEAQRPFQNSRKDWLQRMPGMLRNPSLVCQRQQEADARRDRPSRMSYKEKREKKKNNKTRMLCHSLQANIRSASGQS